MKENLVPVPDRVLVLPEDIYGQTIETLASSSDERVAFYFGKVAGRKMLVTDALYPEPSDYRQSNLVHVDVSPEFISREFPKYAKQGKTLLATNHTHPKGCTLPSSGDIRTHLNVTKYYPDQLTGICVDGKLSFYRYDNGVRQSAYETYDISRFSRQTSIFGTEGQLLISSANITLVGVGGGNAKIAFDLASLGASLTLIDGDTWEEHNRNRIFIPPEHVGLNKANSIRRLVESYYENIRIRSFNIKAQDVDELVYRNSDIIVAGTDTVTGRIFCNRMAQKFGKPLIIPGATINADKGKLTVMAGAVQVVIPNQTPCYECVAGISEEQIEREILTDKEKKVLSEKYGLGNSLQIPVASSIVSLNDVIGGAAVWEIVKLITGIAPNSAYQVYDALAPIDKLRSIAITKNPKCPACSEIKATAPIKTSNEEEILSVLSVNAEKADETEQVKPTEEYS